MINREEAARIAHLARLALTPQEQEALAAELSVILGFVDQLNEVDASGVEPMTGSMNLDTVMREDGGEALGGPSAGHDLLRHAAQTHDGWVRVKKVFESPLSSRRFRNSSENPEG